MQSPYKICTVTQFLKIGGYSKAYFVLNNDLDFEHHAFVPMDTFDSTLDGNGKSLVNVVVTTTSHAGIFITNSGSISNLVVNGEIQGEGVVGGVAASNFGTIDNCQVTVTVSNSGDPDVSTGGIVGYNNGTVSNSTVTPTISAINGATGGVVGYNSPDAKVINTGTTEGNSSVSVNTTGGTSYSGGLVGINDGSITGGTSNTVISSAQDCAGGVVGYNSGSIVGTSANKSVTLTYGSSFGGGLACWNAGSIKRSSAAGNVTGDQDGRVIGGLVGGNDTSGSISDSYARGNVVGSVFLGGLVGYNHNQGASAITRTYAIGTVTTLSNAESIGGLMGGGGGKAIVTDSYWDTEGSNRVISYGGAGITTAQIKRQSTFLNWDFVNVWQMSPTSGYPALRQSSANPTSVAATPVENCGSGAGTTDDPILICDERELNEVRNYSSQSFQLKYFIFLSNSNFVPIPYFSGNFDGNNLSIWNLQINSVDSSDVGLFASNSGAIKNLTVRGTVTGGGSTGAIAGRNSGTLDHCTAIVTVTGNGSNTGGITGNNSGTITFCSATVTVSITSGNVGGISGTNSGTISNSMTSNSTVSNHTPSDDFWSRTGGLVGEMDEGGTLSNSISDTRVTSTAGDVGGAVGDNYGTVTSVVSLKDVSTTGSSNDVGGLAGWNSGTITKSVSHGYVTGTGYNYGGLVGDNYGTISDSYSDGNVSGSTYVGGLAGYNAGNITRAYSVGAVSGSSSVGGLVGNPNVFITQSYWDTQTSGKVTSGGGTGLTTSQMQSEASYSGWDFSTVWNAPTTGNYPTLR